jgi:hypothetical protein
MGFLWFGIMLYGRCCAFGAQRSPNRNVWRNDGLDVWWQAKPKAEHLCQPDHSACRVEVASDPRLPDLGTTLPCIVNANCNRGRDCASTQTAWGTCACRTSERRLAAAKGQRFAGS